eukprot:PhF_6_TR6247/c0_g1_i2/m.9448
MLREILLFVFVCGCVLLVIGVRFILRSSKTDNHDNSHASKPDEDILSEEPTTPSSTNEIETLQNIISQCREKGDTRGEAAALHSLLLTHHHGSLSIDTFASTLRRLSDLSKHNGNVSLAIQYLHLEKP